MPLDFPNSPALNDVYNSAGKTWQWNGTSWVLLGISPNISVGTEQLVDNAVTQAKMASTISAVTICTSSTRPASPFTGQVIFETDTNLTLVYNGANWIRVLLLDSANRFALPASAVFTTESATGRGVGVAASTGDSTAPIVQFTNNAVSTQWASITAPSNGNISFNSDRVQRNGASFINVIDLPTILTDEFAFNGTTPRTYSTATIPTTARYLYLDVFITANSSDHQNLELSNSSTATAIKNWVDARGQQPSTQFSSMTVRRSVYFTYNGEADGYTPNYGVWWSGVLAPCAGNQLHWSMYGNSGSAGWVFLKIMGYST